MTHIGVGQSWYADCFTNSVDCPLLTQTLSGRRQFVIGLSSRLQRELFGKFLLFLLDILPDDQN